MTATLTQYRNAILADKGYTEGPNNFTKFGVWYAERVGNSAFRNAAWCDMSTSYWGSQVGSESEVGVFAWTPSHAQWFVNRGRWSNLPVAGGIAFWDWNGSNLISAIDHVSALIESVDGNGQATTLDGNYGDRVDRWQHPMRYFVGCGLPQWSTSAGSVPPPILTNQWDGKSYPGREAFNLNSYHPAVTLLGQRLVYHGFGGAYKQGPGVPMGPADVANTAAFQRAQGWTGADADGYPGPETWRRLMLPKASAPPPPPVNTRPNISVTWFNESLRHDGPAAQGAVVDEGHKQNALVVERALNREGLLAGSLVDGSAGTSTKSAYAAWQRRLGYTGADADGFAGITSLSRLGAKYGFDVHI